MMYCPDCGSKCDLVFDCSSFPLYECPLEGYLWMWVGDDMSYVLYHSWTYLDSYIQELITKREPALAARLADWAKTKESLDNAKRN